MKRLTVNRVGTVGGAQAPASAPSEDVVSTVLGLVIVGAVYADGRAHMLELPDTFFTPWHSFLYGGLLLLIVWLAVMSRRVAVRSGNGGVAVIPRGYGFAVVGAGMFALGGVADMLWHQVFGVEFGIEALLSPTHLLLFGGGSLLISGPLRSRLARSASHESGSITADLPAVLSVVGMAAIAAFAFAFLSGFLSDAAASVVLPEGAGGHLLSERLASTGLGSYVITSFILVIPFAFLMASRLARPGVLTILVWGGQLVVLDATVGVQWSVAMVTGVLALSAISSVVVVGVLGRRAALIVR